MACTLGIIFEPIADCTVAEGGEIHWSHIACKSKAHPRGTFCLGATVIEVKAKFLEFPRNLPNVFDGRIVSRGCVCPWEKEDGVIFLFEDFEETFELV